MMKIQVMVFKVKMEVARFCETLVSYHITILHDNPKALQNLFLAVNSSTINFI
jgi:hypothetical protein